MREVCLVLLYSNVFVLSLNFFFFFYSVKWICKSKWALSIAERLLNACKRFPLTIISLTTHLWWFCLWGLQWVVQGLCCNGWISGLKEKKNPGREFLFCALVNVYSLITKPKPTQRWLFYILHKPKLCRYENFPLPTASPFICRPLFVRDWLSRGANTHNLYVIARQQLTVLSMVFPVLHLFHIDMYDDIPAIKDNL